MDKTNTMIAKHNLPHRAAGFSLVELMVGVIIAIIGSIVIFQVFAVSENYKRTSVAGSDAHSADCVGLATVIVESEPDPKAILRAIKQGKVRLNSCKRTPFLGYFKNFVLKCR